MREGQTIIGQRRISSIASLLSLMLSLVVFSALSYAQTNSDHTEKFTLINQTIKPARKFSLKRQVNVNHTLSMAEHKTIATFRSAEYTENGSFHSSRMIEKKPKDGQEVVLYKPPLNQGKAVGEFMAGCILGTAAGWGAAYIGSRISYDGSWFSELPGAFIGFIFTYPLGSALGVYTVGNIGSDTGSFGSALGAAYGGILVGAFSAWALSHVSQAVAGLAFLVTPPLLATLAFNKSRRYKNPPAASASLLNFRDGKVNLGFPTICVLPSVPGSSKSDWLVNLASIEF
jgi:hypothetical protein